MRTEPAFYAPVGYSLWWPVLGLALILLIAGWYVYVFRSTRKRPAAQRLNATVAERYLARIQDTADAHAAGRMGSRAAHQELSLTVRDFVHEVTGVRAQRMTLAELRESQLPMVGETIAHFYPGEFAPPESSDVHSAVEAARYVVTSWR